MKRCSWAAFLLLAIAGFASAASWDDDSHYMSLGRRNGYYIVRQICAFTINSVFTKRL